MVSLEDLVQLNRLSHQAVVSTLDRPEIADLGLPTPCSEWSLGELLEHVAAQNRGFTAAARGNARPELWESGPVSDATLASVRDSMTELDQAFTHLCAAPVPLVVPEVHPTQPWPPEVAVTMHLLDMLAHGWDIAQSVRGVFAPDSGALAVALRMAQRMPAGAARTTPGALFGPVVDLAAGDRPDDWTQFLALTGRDPGWRTEEGAGSPAS